jgi:dolichol-phosphate mannosyltransferase
LDFSRNFGKEVATSAGCHFSTGDAVITMDADLQHPPRIILELVQKWEEGFEVVYTVCKENKGASLMKKITSMLYYWLFNKISSVNSEPHSTDFRLMDKKVIDEFKMFSERSRIFRGIIDWMGYRRSRIEFIAPERNNGKVAYSYRKLFGLAVNSITAFSLLPLRIAGYFGIFITIASSVMLLIILLSEIFSWMVFSPVAIIAVANTFLMGVVLICLGFIALYIARIHDEAGGRPLYIIRNKINLR